MVTNDLNLDETAYCMESAKQNGIHVGKNDEERLVFNAAMLENS